MEHQDIVGTDIFGAQFDYLQDHEKDIVFETATSEKIADFAAMQARAQGMSLALVWLEDQDFSYTALDALVVGMADLDGDAEINEEEEDLYNDLFSAVGAAFVKLGADEKNVKGFIDDEDDPAGEKLGEYLSNKMHDVEIDDDELVSGFAVSDDTILEAAYRRVKVIKNGKVVFRKKRIGKPKRLSAKQRAALKKARRKANTGAARKARQKAMRIRKSRGL